MAIITVGAEKGGVGKSRLATHIAAMAAADGVEVVLLDTDKQGSAGSWVSIREGAELRPDEKKPLPVVPLLTLPEKPAHTLNSLSTKYDLVVVDIGAQNYRTMVEAALLSDLVLVPCGADQQEVESTLRVFDALKDLGPRHISGKGRVPAHVVLNRVSVLENASSTADLRAVFEGKSVPVLKSHIALRSSWVVTGKTGRALHELRGKERSEKAISEMRAVYAEIQSLLKEGQAE